MKKKTLFCVLFVFLSFQICHASSFLDTIKNTIDAAGGESGASKTQSGNIDLGLKEALHVGVKNSIQYLGKNDGYFGNSAVKILLPEKIQKTETLLRSIGFGPQLDEFTLSMNRAAEKAAPLAADIFATAITDMSFDDANKILRGGNTAATDYLKGKTYDKLLALFQPAVQKTMAEYQVTEQYNTIAGKVQKLPLVGQAVNLDVHQYVSSKALDGLFYVIAQEEANIRTNPKARVTALLKDVFK